MHRALAASLVLVLAGACSSSNKAQSTTTTTVSVTTTASTAATVSTTTTAAPLIGASTAPVSTPMQGHTQLTAIGAEDKGSFDRLTFTFQGGLPGYGVEYINRPVQEDASGKTVIVKGDNVIRIHMAGASAVDLSNGKVTPTYGGPKRFSPPTPTVQEVVEVGDFEDVLSWAIGVKGKPGFKVTTDAGAGKIILDVAH